MVYVSNFNSGTVSVIDADTFDVIDTIPVGDGPVGIAYDAENNRVYVSNLFSGTVSVFFLDNI